MADELTTTGLAIDSLEDRTEAVKALIRGAIAPNLDLSPDQPSGQLVEIFCERVQSALEVLRAVYGAWDPDDATGDALTALALLTGTQRRAATKGTVTLTVNLDAATTLLAGAVAAVAGDSTNRWVTLADATNALGVPANVTVAAECEDTGPIQALAGTITVIATPSVGWNTVTNAADAVEGLDEETDTELRLRREQELAGGSTSVDAIRAELSALTGMVEVHVLENDLDVSVDGIPPHSIEAVLWDGAVPAVANADIVEAIWEAKAAGIRAYGSTVVDHTDDQGNDHPIGFTRATAQRVLVDVTLTHDASYVGDAAVQAAIETWATASLGCGDDVFRSKISAVVCGLGGVENVSAVLLAIHPAAVAAVDLTIDLREIATIDSADVTVHS